MATRKSTRSQKSAAGVEHTQTFDESFFDAPYAIGVSGSELEPDIPDGSLAIFDPTAGVPQVNEIAAIWLHGHPEPHAARLALAVPPPEWLAAERTEFEPMIAVRAGDSNSKVRFISMRKVRGLHRFLRLAQAGETQS